jgi:hypothetical protein
MEQVTGIVKRPSACHGFDNLSPDIGFAKVETDPWSQEV